MSEQIDPVQRFTGYFIPVELTKLGLSKIEQFLLAMIDSLDSGEPTYCYASNAYLAKHLDLSESRVSFYITKLKRMELIQEISFSGRTRRLKSLKHNWYLPAKQVSKKELCVKARRQTTWKQEGRLRESTNHITNLYKEDDIIDTKSLPYSIDSVSAAPSPADASFLFSSENKEREEDALLEILNKEDEYIKYFKPNVVVRWIKKFTSVRVLDTMMLFFMTLKKSKPKISNPEAWMETALKDSYDEKSRIMSENKNFAEKIKKQYCLRSLKINKRYCMNTDTGNDYQYHLPCERFKEMLVNAYTKRT